MTAEESDAAAREFGGTLGTSVIMILSPALALYLWLAWRFHDGAVFLPADLADVGPFLARAWEQVVAHATPSWRTFAIYWTFLVVEGLMAAFLPGTGSQGAAAPVARREAARLPVQWNHRVVADAGRRGRPALQRRIPVADHLPSSSARFLVAAMITANAVALVAYVGARVTGNAERMSGAVVHDFFMGAWLNPRIGALDLKMWAEVRVSWLTLFLLTASGAAHQHAAHGTLSGPMNLHGGGALPVRQRLREGRRVHPRRPGTSSTKSGDGC